MKRHWFRGVIGGLSFTSALFIFQACYGMHRDYIPDMFVAGKVTAKSTGLPIKNIKVVAEPDGNGMQTNEKGEFSFYSPIFDQIKLTFEDIDSTENGSFQTIDTLINVQEILDFANSVSLEITMEER